MNEQGYEDIIWFLALIFYLKLLALYLGGFCNTNIFIVNIFLISHPCVPLVSLISVLAINHYFLHRKLSEYGISRSVTNFAYILPAIAYPFAVIGLTALIAYLVGVKVDWSLSTFYQFR